MALKILVVDDALFMRKMLRGILEEDGHEVIAEAASGVEAFEQYQKCHPDLTVMDIVMPDKNGIEALRDIMDYHAEAVVVMCSAVGQEALVREAATTGAKDFILKPFDPELVKTVIRKVAGL